ncbi:MAG: response regulator [Salinivirgaceae bacterium]|jgi:two-component system chemotaxis response regulator CheY|nr:response regulator [Salinivirgaceae bacterium]
MDKLTIIYVDDQREVLSTISKDLQVFEKYVALEECESAHEALALLDDIEGEGDHVAVIISDHIMPGKNGVEFLAEVDTDVRFPQTKKMLLTGQATHQDTIRAINTAGIENYIEKPWDAENLVDSVKILLTKYIFSVGIDYQSYSPILHQPTLLNYLSKQV